MAARALLVSLVIVGSSAAVQRARGHDAFWIMDPHDQLCLTTYGTLGPCDGDAMWVYVPRGRDNNRWSLAAVLEPVSKSMCLARKGDTVKGGNCGSSNTQKWEVVRDSARFAITFDRQKLCVQRDSAIWSYRAQLTNAMREGRTGGSSASASALAKKVPTGVAHNTVSIQKCAKGHTSFELHTSNVHEHGFMLASADTMCYDGEKFRPCSDEDPSLRWGFGITFAGWSGAPETQLYKFYNTSSCLVDHRGGAVLGPCTSSAARGWGLRAGRLSRNGDGLRSGKCVQRDLDAKAVLAKCSDNIFEHLTLTLDSDGSDILDQAVAKASAA